MLPVDATIIYGYPVSVIRTPSQPGEILYMTAHERSKKFVQPEGFSLGPHWVGVSPCVPRRVGFMSQHRAVANRVARKVPDVGSVSHCPRRVLRAVRHHTRRFCRSHLEPFSPNKTFDFEEWLDHTHYEAWRKEELRRVRATFPSRVKWQHVKKHGAPKGFIKLENYPQFKFPRGIHARDDFIKAWIGPVIKAIEEKVYKLPQFIKHVPKPDRPEYVMRHVFKAGSKYAATDYSAFESSFHPELMHVCEFELYRYMCMNNRVIEDIRLFEKLCCGINKLRYRDGTFAVEGRRMSGEMTTSLGNGWTNLMIGTLVLKDDRVRCVVEGDDGLFALSPEQLKSFTTEAFADYGFSIKIEVHDDIETASFCGIVFARDVGLNVADPIAELVGFGWSLGPIRISKRRELLVAKALSLLYEYPGAPIMASLGRYVIRCCGTEVDWKYVASTMDNYHRDQLTELMDACSTKQRLGVLLSVQVHQQSRHLVFRKFGLPEELQIRTEKYLDSLEQIQPLEMPWLTNMVHPDLIQMTRFVFNVPAGTTYGKLKTLMPWKM